MEKRHSHKNDLSQQDFLDYLSGKLSHTEMNQVERQLMRDDFDRDAMEGLSTINPDKIKSDLADLSKTLKRNKNRRILTVFMRIAAIIALVMIPSMLVWILITEPTPKTLVADKIETDSSETTMLSESISLPDTIRASENAESKQLARLKLKNPVAAKVSEQPIIAQLKEIRSDKADEIIHLENEQTKEVSIAMAPSQSATTDSSNNFTLNPQQLALNEVVVVGYGTQKKASITGSVSTVEIDTSTNEYSNPTPAMGMTKYMQWIEDKLVYPTNGTGKKEVVVLKLTISNYGKINNIEIIKSPSDDYTNEVKHVLKDSPAWNPATSNNITVEGTRKIRISFIP